MVCSVRVECVSVSSFGEGLAVWVLLSRADRDRRAERSGFGLSDTRVPINNVVQPPGTHVRGRRNSSLSGEHAVIVG